MAATAAAGRWRLFWVVQVWAEAAPLVQRDRGILVLDDNTLDKPYARQIGLVTRHWSGKHRRVVQGINLLTLL